MLVNVNVQVTTGLFSENFPKLCRFIELDIRASLSE